MVSNIKRTIRAIIKNWDTIASFLFIALLFYLTYFALWIFCPCG